MSRFSALLADKNEAAAYTVDTGWEISRLMASIKRYFWTRTGRPSKISTAI